MFTHQEMEQLRKLFQEVFHEVVPRVMRDSMAKMMHKGKRITTDKVIKIQAK